MVQATRTDISKVDERTVKYKRYFVFINHISDVLADLQRKELLKWIHQGR